MELWRAPYKEATPIPFTSIPNTLVGITYHLISIYMLVHCETQ